MYLQVGKKREYNIGKMLHERYGDFLGQLKNDDVYAYRTDYERTKMSLQLVLAALYPSNDETSRNFSWASIPLHWQSFNTSFLTYYFACDK